MIRIALIHDWLTGMRGGESVLEAIVELFPKAELFTLLYVPGKIAPDLTVLKRHTSWLQKIPGAERRYRYFLPWMPAMIEKFDLSGFDLILSSSHCVAKGIKKPSHSVHVSYVHAPMRYIWDRYDDYFSPGQSSFLVRLVVKWIRPKLQAWDRATSSSDRVDLFIGNSAFISKQIQKAYGRTSQVIYPFVNLSRFSSSQRLAGRHYLIVSAFAPYKRIDLAIHAFNRLGLPLLIVGSGQEEQRLKKIAGPNIEFLGHLSNSALVDLYSKCKAFIFPGMEDFGITPLEAMATGAPVIAFHGGGVAETVTDQTGIFFHSQTSEALIEAVQKFERGETEILAADCRKRAAEFSRDRFQHEFLLAVREAWIHAGKNVDAFDQQFKSHRIERWHI